MRTLPALRCSSHYKSPPIKDPDFDYEIDQSQVKGTHLGDSGIFMMGYTCNVCDTKSVVKFTKDAYNYGVVIVNCQGCESTHLIADNLGWFKDGGTNIEEIMKEQGGKFKRVQTDSGVEIVAN